MTAATPEDSQSNALLEVQKLLAAGRQDAAIELLQATLADDPRQAIAHLWLGALFSQQRRSLMAAEHFHLCFTLRPELEKLPSTPNAPAQMVESARQALRLLRQHFVRLHLQILSDQETESGKEALQRIRDCIDIQHGRKKPVFADEMQRPGAVYVPGVPPQPWFEREEIDGIGELEKSADLIREELLALLNDDTVDFSPYVHQGPGIPAAMENLAGKSDWSSYHLYKEGERQEEHCRRCPETIAAVDRMPMPTCKGNAPEVFFSVLKPGVHIRPHYGVANTKLAIHLALIVPDDCALRCGPETRGWNEGQCIIFDDSFEHEAWNHGDSLRAVLILEAWNPYLSDTEKTALTLLCNAISDWERPVLEKWLGPTGV